jgi:hypothetical protein
MSGRGYERKAMDRGKEKKEPNGDLAHVITLACIFHVFAKLPFVYQTNHLFAKEKRQL